MLVGRAPGAALWARSTRRALALALVSSVQPGAILRVLGPGPSDSSLRVGLGASRPGLAREGPADARRSAPRPGARNLPGPNLERAGPLLAAAAGAFEFDATVRSARWMLRAPGLGPGLWFGQERPGQLT